MPQTQTIQNTPAQGESLVYVVRCHNGRADVHELIVRNSGKTLMPRRTPEGVKEWSAAFGLGRVRFDAPTERRPVMQKAMSAIWYGFDRAEVVAHALREAESRVEAVGRELVAREGEMLALKRLQAGE